MSDKWVLNNGLFSGLTERDCIWELNSLYGTIQYAVDQMLHNKLVTNDSIRETKQAHDLRSDAEWIESGIKDCQSHTEEDEECPIFLKLHGLQYRIHSFYEKSLNLFMDVEVQPLRVNIHHPDVGFTTLVASFQEHQSTLMSVCQYLEGILEAPKHITEIEHMKYIEQGRSLITPVCHEGTYRLDAVFGTIIYAAHRMGTRVIGVEVDWDRDQKVLDNFKHRAQAMRYSIETCKQIEESHRKFSSFSLADTSKIQELRRCLLQVHNASMCIIPVALHWYGLETRDKWEGKYQRYQQLLMSACRQLECFIRDTENL